MEWACAQARAERWTEEVQLLQEEMRWIGVFFAYCVMQWESQAGRRLLEIPSLDVGLQEGLRAYAAKQGAMYHDMAHTFKVKWAPAIQDTKDNWWTPQQSCNGQGLDT